MARKDITPQEEMDRPGAGEEHPDEKHEKGDHASAADPMPESEKIRNAHASGLGAMGRHDQKLPEDDAGKPVGY